MGGFNGFSSVMGGIGQAVNATRPLRQNYSNYRDVTAGYDQAKKIYEQSERDIATQAALSREQQQIETAEATRQRKEALKRAVARQQAAFGGQGIDTTDGSGEAVMLGLFKESDAERQYRDRLDKLKMASLNQDVTAKRQRNLLSLQQNFVSARDGLIKNLDRYI